LEHLQQRPFLARAAAPPATLTGLEEAFQSGTPVTAKIVLMTQLDEKMRKEDGINQ
jgi:hypothetical protein